MLRKPLWLPLVTMLLLSPFLLAMGGGGAPVSSDIPRPPINHVAELVDRQGVATEVTQLSCNGKTFFPLQRGSGTLMVPFEKVERAVFGQESGSGVAVDVAIQSGQTLQGTLDGGLLLTGATEFGNYRVDLRGLKEISFR